MDTQLSEVDLQGSTQSSQIQVRNPGLQDPHVLRSRRFAMAVSPAHQDTRRRLPLVGHCGALLADHIRGQLVESYADSTATRSVPIQAGVAPAVAAHVPSLAGVAFPKLRTVDDAVAIMVSGGAVPSVPIGLALSGVV